LSKSNEILTANAPETGYKLCKFYDNRARATPLIGVYIPHFDEISVKICTDGGWNLARRRGPLVPSSVPNFTPSVQHVTPAGRKTSKSASRVN